MTDDQILVTILAKKDAELLPIRTRADWLADVASVRFTRSREPGVELAARGSAQARARASDQLLALSQATLLEIFGKTRAARVGLTVAGEHRARELVNHGWSGRSAALVATVLESLGDDERWLSDRTLCDGRIPPVEVEFDGLPALSAGVLLVRSTLSGVAGWRPGPGAREWADAHAVPELADDPGPHWEHYRDTLTRELRALSRAKPLDPRELGEIPLAPTEIMIPALTGRCRSTLAAG